MANDNETVEQVCEKMDAESGEYHIDDYGLSSYEIGLYKERILAAHKRELAAKDAERLTVSANYEAVIAAKDRVIEAKDAEIAKRDALIKELANALECAVSGFSREVVTYGEAYALIAKARKVIK